MKPRTFDPRTGVVVRFETDDKAVTARRDKVLQRRARIGAEGASGQCAGHVSALKRVAQEIGQRFQRLGEVLVRVVLQEGLVMWRAEEGNVREALGMCSFAREGNGLYEVFELYSPLDRSSERLVSLLRTALL